MVREKWEVFRRLYRINSKYKNLKGGNILKNKGDEALAVVGAVVAIIGVLFLAVIISPLVGWIIGHIVKLVFGNMITNGLNLLFNTTRFIKADIPMLCATLALIGSFFKSTLNSSKNK